MGNNSSSNQEYLNELEAEALRKFNIHIVIRIMVIII